MPKNPKGAYQASRAYEDFSGHKATKAIKVVIELPESAVQIGKLVGVAYEATRDGVTERYFHEFKKSSQPVLGIACKSPGSKAQIVIVGGKYTFTDHGIEDL